MKNMRKVTRQALVLLAVLTVLTGLCCLFFGKTYHKVSLPLGLTVTAGEILPEAEDPEVLRLENITVRNGSIEADVIPLKPGSSYVAFRLPGEEEPVDYYFLKVLPLGTVYDQETLDFSGSVFVIFSVTLFLFLLSAMCLHAFLQARGPAFYAYSTIFYIGCFFFTLITALTMLNAGLRHLVKPAVYNMHDIYSTLSGASSRFLLLTAPLLLLFSAATAVSNLALLRHNRPRIQNLLGLLISVLIVGGGFLALWLNFQDFSGSLQEYRIHSTLINAVCTIYVYFECMLAGSVLCGWLAARRRPPAGREVLIILGCWFRPDGSLPPLLRGRVDGALAYRQKLRQETGREAFLIPSGGQGPDEPMPEAEAMKNYLIAQGVPEDHILPETRSKNTLENCSFSRNIMEEHGLTGPVLLSTTSYHVFRAGVWAAKAGLDAEVIGSKTKWWFWPNAFLRECIGLLANRWKEELLLLAGLLAFFALLSMTLIG